jgi:hypothetical protein
MRALCLTMLTLVAPLVAQEKTAEAAEKPATEEKTHSPWLLTPLLSSSPKMGTAAKLMGAYVTKFDPVSPASMAGVMVQYSNTDSAMAAAFFRGFLLEDRLRLNSMFISGRIHNSYSDFLGTGLPATTQDDLKVGALNALWRLIPNFYVGANVVATNYRMTGEDEFSDGMLDQAGLTGFKSVGAGILAQYDTRDNVNSPTRGQSIKAGNLAFSKSLGGDTSFQNYMGYWRGYLTVLDDSVIASQVYSRWTNNAPPSGLASIHMRGYTQGQYLGESMTSVEAEWRQPFGSRWGGEVFAGVANLSGGDLPSLGNYPSIGLGAYYLIRPQDGMAVCLEGAWGKDGNYGIYLRFGHAF